MYDDMHYSLIIVCINILPGKADGKRNWADDY